MTTHSAYENSVRDSGAKDEGLITVLVEDVPSLTPSLDRPEVDTSSIDPVKLKRKIDFRLLPWLTLLYLMNYLDRGSIGNARVCTLCAPTLLGRFLCTFYPPIAV